ncbi:hypothetical protein K2173_010284 [Erythroxylum novogranatense]|uniref:Uncharacterized protein n=1 Tax=Erythroxylum novogranatense TaxID=1862640 RepID=A0AAV8TFS2_9ROSI|nr:hypothetical protein K2173_010284 [Erythroxylum novogranatense]
MPEAEEDKSKNEQPTREMMMMMELDLDTCPLDQNPFSPLQTYSPLWAFSDLDDDKLPASAPSTLRLSDYPFFLARNPNSVTECSTENDDSRKLPTPFLGVMPVDNPDGYCIIKERMTQALRFLKESTEQHVLAQVWAPVKNGGRYVLTTSGQPFVLDPNSNGLHRYRMASLMYLFSVDGESDAELGLPGRVFRQKLPEWTPNVQYYSSKEYSRLDHALHYNVRGTLALPVFEPSGQSCIGVLELIMTSQKINYASEFDKVCKALEAVNLKSSEILDHPNPQICNEDRQNALVEILEILTVVCETHKLPLAQTWVPCLHRSVLANGGGLKKSCTSFDGSCDGQVCMSATDVAVYVVDAHMWGFREACLEHHLQKGQGVAGRAFFSRNSCFCEDITKFCKTEYPLVHYARIFGLTSCFAICLRSSHTGDDDYILEFFLPSRVTDGHKQKTMLGSLLATIKQHFQSLKVASGMDLEGDGVFVEIIQASANGKLDLRLECLQVPTIRKSAVDSNTMQNDIILQQDSVKRHSVLHLDVVSEECNPLHEEEVHAHTSLSQDKAKKKPAQRKRGKTEKSISLEVLQKYFAGSLKDAAKSLGVCPTTMKRICRQHGISRWPSRKINKVNRSLSKLKRVIESVQGAEGAFSLTPITTTPLPAAVGSISFPSNMKGCNQLNSPNPKLPIPHCDKSESSPSKASGNRQVGDEDHLIGSRMLNQEKRVMNNQFSPELAQSSYRSKTGSGLREESAGTPTSHGSCQSTPTNENAPAQETSVSPIREKCIEAVGSPDMSFPLTGELNLSGAYSIPGVLLATDVQEPFGGMLIEDAGSSKDLRNLCPSVADAPADDRFPESSWTNPPWLDTTPREPVRAAVIPSTPHVMARQEMKSITIKATYREDIIRFRISLNAGIVELKEEVAKRLKLEVGTFDIKYLDDDHEWVLIACDADLQECVDISRLSGSNIIRLSVQDVNVVLGSSCESTGEL